MTTLQKKDNKLLLQTDYINVDKCRLVPGGKWNKSLGCWEYPIESAIELIEKFPDAEYDVTTKNFVNLYTKMIKEVNLIKSYKKEPREHPFLMKHQRICRDIASLYDKYAFFLDTGTGKTITALSIVQDNPDMKWLIICPKSIIKTAWCEDQREFFPDIKLLPLSRNMSRENYLGLGSLWGLGEGKHNKTFNIFLNTLKGMANAYIINPESFKADIKEIEQLGITGLIIDESSMIKNPTSQITKMITSFSDKMDKLYLLSGKPAPNNEMEYFPQIRLVDQSVFGTSLTRFRERYFTPYGFMGYEWRIKPGASEQIASQLDKCSIFIKKEDCLDLPEKTYIIRNVELPTPVVKMYKEMEKEQLLTLSDTAIEAPYKLTMLMKLRQITSGFVIDTENEGKTEHIHDAKLNELEDVINELGENKAIIWINFKEEVRVTSRLLDKLGRQYVTAFSETKDVDVSIKAFKEDKAQFIIAHPQTLKYGVTFTGSSMVKNCTYAIYYSLSYSYEDYYQSHDRIYRKGQTEKCTFMFLLAEKTIDYDIYDVLKGKGSRSDIIENFVRRLTT